MQDFNLSLSWLQPQSIVTVPYDCYLHHSSPVVFDRRCYEFFWWKKTDLFGFVICFLTGKFFSSISKYVCLCYCYLFPVLFWDNQFWLFLGWSHLFGLIFWICFQEQEVRLVMSINSNSFVIESPSDNKMISTITIYDGSNFGDAYCWQKEKKGYIMGRKFAPYIWMGSQWCPSCILAHQLYDW